jgi:Anti-sigma factor NepR
MQHDEDAHKGMAVTKPIDLRANKAGMPIRGREKGQCADHRETSTAKVARTPAPVSALSAARGRKTAPKPEIIDQIGLRLRGVYNDVLMQPIPDRFIDLLSQLETGAAPCVETGIRKTGSKKDAK